ncbi:UDP-N-acetylmuramoylalanine--D-glutamate ligase [Nocardioides phosphati]|uniref:UDP-N-acetylmuramoylalanine--D-glutamate ligase n=1 Tax=Nocardioides phosphati TaxID=1867775 RepID=A0ABQ2NA21_9ACTN|nr:UDP-N-acetylmuramoyl-L-alanine--D-glutamate ligase [Nocardioides phosphati]GGO87200.1 UDP-N-acetylmuramoylalanine--D-glutamate ligase [Nocardioides phosphati]
MRFSDLEGRKVAVWGLGLEGRSALAELQARGIDVTVAESDADADVLRAAEVVVKSPGIPVTSALYGELAASGVHFTSVTDLFLSDNAARAIGVTGTKGKSTTSSAIAHLLTYAGVPAALAGNIGASLLDAPADGTVVLEVSSYQAQSITVSPRVAVVTSLFPEHLPWHGSEEAYFADKLKLVATAEHVVVPGHDEALVARVTQAMSADATLHLTGDMLRADESGLTWDGVGSIPPGELPLIGVHNARNLALAVLAAHVAEPSLDPATLLDGVRTFAALTHRMETVPSKDGRRWIDDSLATAPEAVIAALSVFPDEPVALILGGADRGLDLSPLADYLRTRHSPVHLLLIGPAGSRFGREHADGLGHAVLEFGRMADAVAWGLSVANPAQVVLLSPGAPSFDEYKDYADRARHMRELIAPAD